MTDTVVQSVMLYRFYRNRFSNSLLYFLVTRSHDQLNCFAFLTRIKAVERTTVNTCCHTSNNRNYVFC